MPKTLHSDWYHNGEDVIFTDEAFHDLAYRITATYQRVLHELELAHGVKRARHEAWIKGWRHEWEVGVYEHGQAFYLPGYELRISTRHTDKGPWRVAEIVKLFE